MTVITLLFPVARTTERTLCRGLEWASGSQAVATSSQHCSVGSCISFRSRGFVDRLWLLSHGLARSSRSEAKDFPAASRGFLYTVDNARLAKRSWALSSEWNVAPRRQTWKLVGFVKRCHSALRFRSGKALCRFRRSEWWFAAYRIEKVRSSEQR